MIVRLEKPTSGQILVDGEGVANLEAWELGGYRRKVQMILQDPYALLDPKMKVGPIIGEPLYMQRMGACRSTPSGSTTCWRRSVCLQTSGTVIRDS